MGSTASRVAQGVSTFGASEIVGQVGKSIPGKTGRSITGFSRDPLHAVVKGLGRMVTMSKPSFPQRDVASVQQAASEAAARRSRSRGARSTILSQSFLSADNPALKDTYGT